jgi:hypothetical protein
MARQPRPATGWPFLVAPGRRRDYTILLAPQFLVDEVDYGFLDRAVRPDAESGPATVTGARTRAGRELTLVYATHRLTAADTGSPDVRDEHGRPLRLIYGFATVPSSIPDPDRADLACARETALRTYRRFLADEDTLTVAGSSAFPLLSHVDGPPPPAAGTPSGRRIARLDPLRLVMVVTVVALALLGVLSGLSRCSTAPVPATPCPTASAPTASPTPSCAPSTAR